MGGKGSGEERTEQNTHNLVKQPAALLNGFNQDTLRASYRYINSTNSFSTVSIFNKQQNNRVKRILAQEVFAQPPV